ncbi:MAG: type II toxin-antitoxin system VapC family toxin [Rectinemataceae bacterium]|jgi:PIN domain nuclease of toxin-antitoxin system
MKYLVDTQALLWWDAEPVRIGSAALKEFSNPDNTLYVSHASVWELAIKLRLEKLQLPSSLGVWLKESVQDNGFTLLPISLDAIMKTQDLIMHHGDPFDRLLIAQAIVNNWPVLSSDAQWDRYPVQRIW